MNGSDKFNAFSGKLRFAGTRFKGAKPDLQAYAALVSEVALLQKAFNAGLEEALKNDGHKDIHDIVAQYGFDADVRSLQPGSTIVRCNSLGGTNAQGQHFQGDMLALPSKETIKTWADTFFAGLKTGFSDLSLVSRRVLTLLFDAGAYLKEGEEVEISRDGDSEPARINHGYGRQVQQRVEAAQKQMVLPTELYGRVSVIDGKMQRFAFEPIGMPSQTIAFDNKDRDIIHASLRRYGHPINRFLRLRLSHLGKDKRAIKDCQLLLDKAEEVVDRLPARLQLHPIKQLKKGWYFGDGTTFDSHKLDQIASDFEQYWGEHPIPAFAPNADGALVLEWRFGDWSVSADISLENAQFSTYWHALNLKTDEMREEDNIPLNSPAGWQRLTQLVASLQEG